MTRTLRMGLLFGCIAAGSTGLILAQQAGPQEGTAGQGSQVPEVAQPEQVGPREATFKEASTAFERASELNAEVLSPRYFAEARKSYQKAMEVYDRGGKLADVRANLAKCKENLDLATKTAEICQVALKDLLAVRRETLASGFSLTKSNDFREAEKKLQQAAQKVERGDLKGAQKPSRESAERYRKAVLQILEKEVLPDAKRKLRNLKSSYDKQDYKRAEDALKNLERQVKAQNKAAFSVAELTSRVKAGIEQALTPQASAARQATGGN